MDKDQSYSIRAVYKYGKFTVKFNQPLTFVPPVYANDYKLDQCSLTNNNYNITCKVITNSSPLKILTIDTDKTNYYTITVTESRLNIGLRLTLVTPPVFRIKKVNFPTVSGDTLPSSFTIKITALLIPNNNYLAAKTVYLPVELNGQKVSEAVCTTNMITFTTTCNENYELSCSCSIQSPIKNGEYKMTLEDYSDPFDLIFLYYSSNLIGNKVYYNNEQFDGTDSSDPDDLCPKEDKKEETEKTEETDKKEDVKEEEEKEEEKEDDNSYSTTFYVKDVEFPICNDLEKLPKDYKFTLYIDCLRGSNDFQKQNIQVSLVDSTKYEIKAMCELPFVAKETNDDLSLSFEIDCYILNNEKKLAYQLNEDFSINNDDCYFVVDYDDPENIKTISYKSATEKNNVITVTDISYKYVEFKESDAEKSVNFELKATFTEYYNTMENINFDLEIYDGNNVENNALAHCLINILKEVKDFEITCKVKIGNLYEKKVNRVLPKNQNLGDGTNFQFKLSDTVKKKQFEIKEIKEDELNGQTNLILRRIIFIFVCMVLW